ncbi:hypothetical protein YC2023_122379 [Brassica napus]
MPLIPLRYAVIHRVQHTRPFISGWAFNLRGSIVSAWVLVMFERGFIASGLRSQTRGICGLAARDDLRGSKKEFNKTEDDLKSLQSVVIVKASSGPRYVVGCRSKVDKEKLISATRVVLDMTTLTIMRALPREAFTQHLSIYVGDAEEECPLDVTPTYPFQVKTVATANSSLNKPPATHHYSAFQTHTPSMATLNLMFSDLKAGCCANTVEA